MQEGYEEQQSAGSRLTLEPGSLFSLSPTRWRARIFSLARRAIKARISLGALLQIVV